MQSPLLGANFTAQCAANLANMKPIYFRLTREAYGSVFLEVKKGEGWFKVYRGPDEKAHLALAGLRAGIEAANCTAISQSPEFSWK